MYGYGFSSWFTGQNVQQLQITAIRNYQSLKGAVVVALCQNEAEV